MKCERTAVSRRTFIGGAAALAASTVLSDHARSAAIARPNSNFNGVQIGVITYSYRSIPGSAGDLLEHITTCGISSIELMGDMAESFAGAPAGKKRSRELQAWRLSASMDRFSELRRMYNDAGVNIHIVKFGDIGNANMSDEQIDYYFKVAKTLGATGITRELSESAAAKLGPIADKHEIMIGFHNHTQLKPTTYDSGILNHGKYLGINLDIGHYVAGTNHSPIPLIEKYGDRIISLHLKDRKVNGGANMPFGQGDTPLALLLQYMKRNRLSFPGDIELEYKVPEGSNAVQEVKKCVEFCKAALA